MNEDLKLSGFFRVMDMVKIHEKRTEPVKDFSAKANGSVLGTDLNTKYSLSNWVCKTGFLSAPSSKVGIESWKPQCQGMTCLHALEYRSTHVHLVVPYTPC
jgi:hypothetical protein